MKLGLILSHIETPNGSPIPRFADFRDMSEQFGAREGSLAYSSRADDELLR